MSLTRKIDEIFVLSDVPKSPELAPRSSSPPAWLVSPGGRRSLDEAEILGVPLAILFANGDEAKALAKSIGAAKLLDQMELANELIPAILELAPAGSKPS